MNKKILYFGSFYTLRAVEERGLPSRNIAGYNRMKRFAHALIAIGVDVEIISSAVCMRPKWKGALLYPALFEKVEGIKVQSVKMLGIPFVGFFFEPFFLCLWALKNIKRGDVSGVLIYNFNPAYAWLAILLKILRIPFFSQIEDVSIPELRDWGRNSETRPIQQILYWFCMRVMTALSKGIIVPSRRFCVAFNISKPQLVITGCMDTKEFVVERSLLNARPLKVLFVGKYQKEHGVDVLCDAIRLLRKDSSIAGALEFHCCGSKNYIEELKTLSQETKEPSVILHGFLNDQEYKDLLQSSHIALALQKSNGRHSQYKTPSKAYEFQAYGKLVLAYDIGDLADLADDKLALLREESAEELYKVLKDCLSRPEYWSKIRDRGAMYACHEYSSGNVGRKLVDFFNF